VALGNVLLIEHFLDNKYEHWEHEAGLPEPRVVIVLEIAQDWVFDSAIHKMHEGIKAHEKHTSSYCYRLSLFGVEHRQRHSTENHV